MSSKEAAAHRGPYTSSAGQRATAQLADQLALKVQEWHSQGKIDGEQPLLRVDNRQQSAEAPFQFDMVRTRLHRTGCAAIPAASKSALYAVWEVTPADARHACEECRPVPTKEEVMETNHRSDMLFGFISILDQFGSVLYERGREYRNSERGRQLEGRMTNLLSDMDQTEQDMLDLVLSSLDRLLCVIEGYTARLNGGDGMNGSDGKDRMAVGPPDGARPAGTERSSLVTTSMDGS